MVLAQFSKRTRIASLNGSEEFFRLTMKLFRIGSDRQAAGRHDEPPSVSPWSAGVGQGGSAIASEQF
jgi:hypothetical protein